MDTGDRINLLYIEDDLASLKALETYFNARKGYEFFSASNAAEGLSLANSISFDLVLVDLDLPIMDGYAVLSRLRANPNYVQAPVLALTANSAPAEMEKGLRAGFDHYIIKPIPFKILESKIQTYL